MCHEHTVGGPVIKMVKAAVMFKPLQPLEIRDFAEPVVEPGAVVIDTLYSEVCGTDVHLYHGRLEGVPYPIIPGHISLGYINTIRGQIRDVDGAYLQVGDLVTFLDVYEVCNDCWFCLVARASTRCPNRKVYGITSSANDGLLGGWSEKIYLKPGVKIIKLPDSIKPEAFIGGGCGLFTAFHGVERAGIRLGDTVVIQGSGPVGLNATILSQLAGALQVILIGGPSNRLELGRDLGADHVIDIFRYSPEERVEIVLELTKGKGADVTIEATGFPDAVHEGMAMTRDAGTYVVLGQYTDNGTVILNPHLDLNKKHLNVRGTWGTDFSHFYRSIQLMAKYSSRFQWEKLISKRYSLKEVNRALQEVEEQRVIKAVIQPHL